MVGSVQSRGVAWNRLGTGADDEEAPDHATEESNFMFASTDLLHDFDENLDFPTSTAKEVEEVSYSKIAAPVDSGNLNLNLKLSDAEAKYWSAAAPPPTASELGSSHTTKTCGQRAAETSAASSFAPPPIAESVSVDEKEARKELSVLQQELRTATRAHIESKAPVITPVPIAFDTDDVGPTPPIPVRNAQQFVPISDAPQAMPDENDLLQKHMDSYSNKSVSSAVTAAELKLIDLRVELDDLRAAKVEKELTRRCCCMHTRSRCRAGRSGMRLTFQGFRNTRPPIWLFVIK